jgi:thiamine biosynthesis lipoprotein
MDVTLSRRRFIRIAASAACLGAVASTRPMAAEPAPLVWSGLVLGNLASIEIRHPNGKTAQGLLERARVEIARLESIMSLYRPESALSVLNDNGVLRNPPLDLVQVLGQARRFGQLTRGAFDVTVQPLWRVYAEHFATTGARSLAGPSSDSIRRAVERVDYRALEIEPSVVGLRRPGVTLTLNGIAQGYITDRIAELLNNEGLDHVLVDLGEIRGLGTRDGVAPWCAGIENVGRSGLVAEIPLANQALSTSGSYGFRFDSAGRFHHIFDPRSGACAQLYASVSVLAPDATTSDALATACNLTPLHAIPSLLRAAGGTMAYIILPDGAVTRIEA